MSSRNKAIKKAFLDGYKQGDLNVTRGVSRTDARMRMEFGLWCTYNDHLLDTEPDVQQIIRAVEAKLERNEQEAST